MTHAQRLRENMIRNCGQAFVDWPTSEVAMTSNEIPLDIVKNKTQEIYSASFNAVRNAVAAVRSATLVSNTLVRGVGTFYSIKVATDDACQRGLFT